MVTHDSFLAERARRKIRLLDGQVVKSSDENQDDQTVFAFSEAPR
jgi:ABC-type lipoprotein export system ATPase subunit